MYVLLLASGPEEIGAYDVTDLLERISALDGELEEIVEQVYREPVRLKMTLTAPCSTMQERLESTRSHCRLRNWEIVN